MLVFNLFLTVILAVFSTAVMSYVSMAIPIGPWMGPTLALIAMLFFNVFRRNGEYSTHVALVTSAGAIGGIMATGFAFSYPALYFLDQALFSSWMADPFYFSGVMTCFALVAGGFGLWCANVLEEKLVVQEKLSFPISELIHKTIAIKNELKKSIELMIGFWGTAIFCVLQDGVRTFQGFIPRAVTLLPAIRVGVLNIPLVRFDIWPMLWAIGFVTGHVIAIPLAVGVVSRLIIVDPLNSLFFPAITGMEFLLAFCSGLVLSGALLSVTKFSKLFRDVKKMLGGGAGTTNVRNNLNKRHWVGLGCVVISSTIFFSYFQFPLITQFYLLIFTFVCTYELAVLAGKIGLAPLGRFATFVMVPAMLLMPLTMVQIVFIATFVQVCAGVAVEILFGRKLAHLANIERSAMERYQWIGLLVSSLSVGIIFWLLINQFGLGSQELFVLKAQNRALLINVRNFDYTILILGVLFGFLLKKIRVNPSLALGGLLMPINISLGLVVGGLSALLASDKERWYPFWSGVYAANSLWMLIKAVL